MNEIIEKTPNELADSTERIELDLTEIDTGKAEVYLANVLELIKAKANTPTDIQPEKRYYLDIPKELQEMMDRGEAWFTEKKDNKKAIAQLRHIDEDGHNRIFTYPTIKEEDMPNVNEGAPTGPDMYQMALMQQIAEISEEIKEVRKAVEYMHIDIQKKKKKKIESAYTQLLLADSVSNPITRVNQINNAIQTLSEGKLEIKKALETRLERFERVPGRDFNIYIKMFKHKDYLGEKRRELEEICKLFDYFDKAGKLHIRACMMLNEPEAARTAAKLHAEQFRTLMLSNVNTVSNVFSLESIENEWYMAPGLYLENTDSSQRLLETQRDNGITIALTGKQLMEAINNGE